MLTLTGCKKSVDKKEKIIPTVSIYTTNTQAVANVQNLVARTVATNQVNIFPRIEGLLINKNFIEGSIVNKNQILYEIDDDKYQIDVNRTKSQLDICLAKSSKSQKNLSRGKKLISEKSISEEEYENLVSTAKQDKAAVDEATANYQQAKLNLSYTKIRSPLNGLIGMTNYYPGNLINTGNSTPLAEIINIDPIYAVFYINEKNFHQYFASKTDLEWLNNHFQLVLTLSDQQIYKPHGKFDFISPKVDLNTDTLTFRANFPNPKGILRPGMYVNLQIIENQKILPVVPNIAIQHDQQGAFVYTVENHLCKKKIINLGPAKDDMQAVVSGLQKGEQVIVEGFMHIKTGKKVNTTLIKFDNGKIIYPKKIATKD